MTRAIFFYYVLICIYNLTSETNWKCSHLWCFPLQSKLQSATTYQHLSHEKNKNPFLIVISLESMHTTGSLGQVGREEKQITIFTVFVGALEVTSELLLPLLDWSCQRCLSHICAITTTNTSATPLLTYMSKHDFYLYVYKFDIVITTAVKLKIKYSCFLAQC